MSRWPVAGPSQYWLIASSPASKVKTALHTYSTANTHKITTHTRQLQQYTRSTNNNYTKDNLKLATKYTRQIRILQYVQKLKTPKQDSTVYSFLLFFFSVTIITNFMGCVRSASQCEPFRLRVIYSSKRSTTHKTQPHVGATPWWSRTPTRKNWIVCRSLAVYIYNKEFSFFLET